MWLWAAVLTGQTSVIISVYADGDTVITREVGNGDTVTRLYDRKQRLTAESVNGYLTKRIEYIRQDSILHADFLRVLSRREEVEFSYPFQAGDTVTVEVHSLVHKKIKPKHCGTNDCYYDEDTGQLKKITPEICPHLQRKDRFVTEKTCHKNKIRQIDFIQGEQGNRFSAIDRCAVKWRDVITVADAYTLKIRNSRFLHKQHVHLKAVSRPRDIAKVTEYVRDTVEVEDTAEYFVYDTLLIPVLDEVVYLPPLLNIEKVSYRILNPVFTLPDYTHPGNAWSYWIGVGEDAEAAWQNLTETVPPALSKPGAEAAIGAYALGRNIILPTYTEPQVGAAFGGRRTMQRLQRQINNGNYRLPDLPPFRRNIDLPAGENDEFLLLLNRDSVNGYYVYVKAVALQITAEKQEKTVTKTVIGKPRPTKAADVPD